jgi:hypothetical protein
MGILGAAGKLLGKISYSKTTTYEIQDDGVELKIITTQFRGDELVGTETTINRYTDLDRMLADGEINEKQYTRLVAAAKGERR